MDGNLFKKYEQRIQNNKTQKENLIYHIQGKTDILLEEKEVLVSGKKIKIQTSSTKKMLLQKRDIQKVLRDKGYELSP